MNTMKNNAVILTFLMLLFTKSTIASEDTNSTAAIKNRMQQAYKTYITPHTNTTEQCITLCGAILSAFGGYTLAFKKGILRLPIGFVLCIIGFHIMLNTEKIITAWNNNESIQPLLGIPNKQEVATMKNRFLNIIKQ